MADALNSIAEELRKASVASLLPGHTDSARLIRLHTGNATHSLLAESIQGIEQIAPAAHTGAGAAAHLAGFAFDLKVLCSNASLDAPDWLGKPILIELLTQQSRTALRPFHGHVTAFERLTADGAFGYYRLRIEPWLAFLGHRRDSFAFHDMSVPEIIEAVFADYAGQGTLVPQWRLDLADAYPKRSVCTQYLETDLAFIERLMAEEGLFYWFEHAGSGTLDSASHTLVIADHSSAFADNAQSRIRFHRAEATEKADTIQTLAPQRSLATHAIEIASWDYRSLDTRAASSIGTPDSAAVDMPLTRFDAPGAYVWPTREQGERYAARQIEAIEGARQILSGSGTVRSLAPGSRFTLDDHFDADLPADTAPEDRNRYTVLSVTHRARNNLNPTLSQGLTQLASGATPTRSAEESAALYNNTFTLLPAHLPYRPVTQDAHGIVLRARPSVRGAQSAIVVGEPGQPVHTDRDGRIRVQFHWQRGSQSHNRLTHPSGADDASADTAAWSWVRVMTPWAGANWGGHFIPRIGQEVLVEFIEGDIDRPVVVGALYNGQGAGNAQHNQVAAGAGVTTGNAPAWFAGDAADASPATASGEGHAHAASLTGIKTQAMSASQSGSGGFNQLVFDLTPNEPRTQLATTQFASTLSLGAIRHQYGNQRLAYRAHGAELATAQSGALRAAAGMLLSTDARNGATGTQMDARLAGMQLESAYALVKTMAESAQKQKAELKGEPGPDKLAAAEAIAKSQQILAATDTGSTPGGDQGNAAAVGGGAGTVPAWSEPMMVAESPAGIAALTPKDAILCAGNTLTLAAADIHIAAQGKSAWAVKDGIALYTYGKATDSERPVQDKGLMIHAAQGKVSVQAQSDKADFNADKKVTITSTTKDVLLQGKNDLQLTAGGAAIQISGGNITLTAPGKVELKGSQRNLTSAKSVQGTRATFGSGGLSIEGFTRAASRNYLQFIATAPDGAPLAGKSYAVLMADGSVRRGTTDGQGKTETLETEQPEHVQIYIDDAESEGFHVVPVTQ